MPPAPARPRRVPAVSSVTRLKRRSRSSKPSSARRSSSRCDLVFFTPASTESRRALISARSSDGRSNQA